MTTLEITVVSAEGLDKYSSSSYFSTRIRPFITLTKLPARVEYQYDGEHMFRVPVDPTFFSDACSCLHLQLYNKRRIVGSTQLGWCLIPPSDIGFPHSHSPRFLSYRLRATDGSKCPVIVNLSIRIICSSSFYAVTGIPLKPLAHSKPKMDFEGQCQSQSHLVDGTTSQ